MKTLTVTKKGSLEVVDVQMPKYSPEQALVKTIACGICNGTDAKLIHKNFKGYDEKRYPLMLGHEAVGRIIEVGANVKSLKKGDIVLLPFNDPTDEYDSGWGAFSEYGIVNDPESTPKTNPELFGCALSQTVIPDNIDPTEAVVIITLREVLSSIKRFGIEKDSNVVVYGCGPVGLTFIRFLSLLGVENIIAFDISDDKAVQAKAQGAKQAYNSMLDEPVETVKGLMPEGADYVIDAVGLPQIINQAMMIIADQGKICCYGISPISNMEIDWSKAPYNWQIQFQQFPSKAEEFGAHEQIITWIKDGEVRLQDYISDIVPFDNILQAFEKLEKKEITKKCIISFE